MRQDDGISRRVIGCAFKVSNGLGAGFLESVYENALCIELADSGIAFERQKELIVRYRGRIVGTFVADLVVEGCLLVELKAVNRHLPEHEAQVMNYLRATGLSVGLLLNFGLPRLDVRRIVWQHDDEVLIIGCLPTPNGIRSSLFAFISVHLRPSSFRCLSVPISTAS